MTELETNENNIKEPISHKIIVKVKSIEIKNTRETIYHDCD